MTPPSVTFVSSHARHGGSERYLTTLLSHLPRDWITKVVVLEQGPLVDELDALRIPTVVLPTSGTKASMLRAVPGLSKTLRQANVGVVHANGVKAGLLAALACAAGGPPVVWVKHDFSWDGPLVALTAALSTATVGVSHAVLETLPKGLARKARVVPTGLEVPAIDRVSARSTLISELGMAGDVRLIAHVGRMHPVKGHQAIVEAMAGPALREGGIHLLLVGGADPSQPGYERDVRDLIGRLGVAHRVHLLGHRSDALAVIAASDVLAITSGRDERGMGLESFSLVAVEAMTLGTPVVAFAGGGIPEVVGDCGRLVPLGDTGSLAAAIRDLLKDEVARVQVARCGQARVADRFRAEAMVRSMQDVYVEAAR